MNFNDGFELNAKETPCPPQGQPAASAEIAQPWWMSGMEEWIELNDEPLRADMAWEAEPPSLFSRKLWLR
ncbi:hypothetical protein SAMN05444156_0077 [Verrucomicrobium sp. GAS474]|uniref:hypothetical protein n=1 Tax=Verrucomicrobium sp. GAS474 TaxID=1882831 RepID=UPI00087B495C|nr:hypothetical protein [Verrucomicrobium sp. GAS474]SDT85925.1 hypothetical protein SAMN05444156_0077 [Verrucomicrobium sp. GAS474]